jgi:UDP-2,3-diacylglucosamine pyrophosphatase LpxH
LYLGIQRIDPQHRASRWVKRTSKKWLRLANKVATDAIRHGRKHHAADVVICGHTHLATIVEIEDATYVNSGCWTDLPSTYVVVETTGELKLLEY